MPVLKFEEESFRIRGAIFEVFREIGCGFLEAVYQECLEKEFRSQEIPFSSHKELLIYYKGLPLQQIYKPDFICFDQIIVEIKAVAELTNEHFALVQHYLHASGLELGFLVNFNHHPKAQIERIVK